MCVTHLSIQHIIIICIRRAALFYIVYCVRDRTRMLPAPDERCYPADRFPPPQNETANDGWDAARCFSTNTILQPEPSGRGSRSLTALAGGRVLYRRLFFGNLLSFFTNTVYCTYYIVCVPFDPVHPKDFQPSNLTYAITTIGKWQTTKMAAVLPSYGRPTAIPAG